jgi:uncharacterized protein (DUF488 family)
MEEEEKKQQESKEFLGSIIDMLARLASDKMYGPLDVLATTPDISVALGSLYNAIRYAKSQGYAIPSEEEFNAFVAIAKKNPEVMREIAIKALIRAEKMKQPQQQIQQQSDRKESKQVG